MISYTRDEVEQIVKIKPLYQMPCVNWRGTTAKSKTNGGGEYYSEIIAEIILNDEKLLNLPCGKVRDSFNFFRHDGSTKNADSSRKEERFCLEKYKKRNSELSPFGKIINYQVNIFVGTKINVDLVAYDKKSDTLWLIEVKGNGGKSDETLLRCALEIETYYRCLQSQKQVLLTTLSSKDEGVQTSENTKIQKGILVPEKSLPAREYSDLDNRPKVKDLMECWKIRFETY